MTNLVSKLIMKKFDAKSIKRKDEKLLTNKSPTCLMCSNRLTDENNATHLICYENKIC